MILQEASVSVATQMRYARFEKHAGKVTGVVFESEVGDEVLTLSPAEFADLGDPDMLWLYLGTGDKMWR